MRWLAFALAVSPTVGLAQQPLDRRVSTAPDGTIQFSYATRAGICGDGRSFLADAAAGPSGSRTWVFHGNVYMGSGSPDWRLACREGPAWIVLTKSAARISRLEVFVGPELRLRAPGADLGRVGALEAARWLLDLGESSPSEEVTRHAFLAATVADSARLTERLIEIARNRDRRSHARERAVRWLAETVEREGTGPAADAAMQALINNERDVRSVRERAIRDLRHTTGNDAFLRQAYGRITDLSLKERMVRRLGESWSDDNTRWMRALAVDAREPLTLRERAVRMLGEELVQHTELITLYGELTEISLKERVLRLVGEQGDADGLRWLRTVATNRAEHSTLRERALRILGEQGQAAYLRELYPQLDASSLKERVIRTVGEYQSSGDREWLLQRVLDTGEDHALRDRALRSWAETAGSADVRSVYARITERDLRDRLLRIAGERGERAWLREVAANPSEAAEIRDRAVRLFAEQGGSTEELIGLYDGSRARDVQARVVRLLAERQDDDAIDKLIAIARSDPDTELRRLALRRLAETSHPRARSFLQETVRR